MDFVDQIKSIAANIPNQLDHILTEEATKSALVMPFIQALGYNVFDITEVVPEFDANVGASKKYKLDYAILQEGQPIILIECKHHTDALGEDARTQLFHYFAATHARIGVLTNGVTYRFYSDLVETNKLDEKPFLELNLLNLQEPLIEELKKLSKHSFDIEEILSAASELKYTKEIKRILLEQFNEPTEDFVKFFAAQVYSGSVTKRVREEFTPFVKRAFRQFVREQISGLLQSASNLADAEANNEAPAAAEEMEEETNGIETTDIEIEGFHIVRAIVSEIVDPGRITYSDKMSYCNVLLDNKTTKPICRMYFNNPERKSIGLFTHGDEGKQEEKISLDEVHDL